MPDKPDGGGDHRSLAEDIFIGPGERDAISIVREASRAALPKRFYSDVTIAEAQDGYGLRLDGRPMRTPRAAPLVLPTPEAAEHVAAEWRSQSEVIDPATMPLTRLVNSAIDGVAQETSGVSAEIAKYAGSDLVCYRASDPHTLVAAQAKAWDPVLAFAGDRLGALSRVAHGVIFTPPPAAAVAAVAAAIDAIGASDDAAFRIAALHVVTTLTGSALIALAVYHGALSPEAAWDAAHVDEDEQMRLWGYDAEALRRRAKRLEEMKAACALLDALGTV